MKGGESRGRAENPRQEVFAKLLFVRRQASAGVRGPQWRGRRSWWWRGGDSSCCGGEGMAMVVVMMLLRVIITLIAISNGADDCKRWI